MPEPESAGSVAGRDDRLEEAWSASPETLEAAAMARLPVAAARYFGTGGASGEVTAENRRALARLRLVPRILRDVHAIRTTTSALGETLQWPLLVAPMASLRVAHPEGELAVARASAGAGVGMVLSTSATTPVEEVAAVTGSRTWFQLYALADRGATRALVERAATAGARALVLTVDVPPLAPLPGRATTDVALPDGLAWPHHGPSPEDERHLDWRYLEELVAWSPLPIAIKGVLHADDAARAAGMGVAGVIVSNHGGRVSDGLVASIEALPAVVDRVADTCEVYVDGGIRTGLDVLRALALGARAVLIGRPVLWGLVLAGEEGVAGVLEEIKAGLLRAAAVAGTDDLAAVDRGTFR